MPAPYGRAGPRRWKNADAFIQYFQARSAASKAKPVGNRPGSTAVTNANYALPKPRKHPRIIYDIILVIVAGGVLRSDWSPLVMGGLARNRASSGTGAGAFAAIRLAARRGRF